MGCLKKKDYPSNIYQSFKRDSLSLSDCVNSIQIYRGKKTFRTGKDRKKKQDIRHHVRACQRISCHTLTHASMQISRNDIPKLPFRAALMTSRTARTRESQLHVDRYPPCASSQQAAKDVRIYTYTELSKDYDVLNNAMA